MMFRHVIHTLLMFWAITCQYCLSYYRKVLATLDQTRNDVKVMKKAIKTITSKYEESKVETAQLLKQLTEKATKLEKLKAKVGLSSSLDAYLHLNELESDEDEEDDLLKTGEFYPVKQRTVERGCKTYVKNFIPFYKKGL